MLHLEVPANGQRVLLHCCCAPCSGAVVECLVQNGIRPALFFSNSNIVPFDEYVHRRSELERYAAKFGLECIDDDYNHQEWLDFVLDNKEIPGLAGNDGTETGRGALAAAPERGPRCLKCFKFRLMRAAKYAAENGFDVLTTTLASSRWKSLEQVEEAGQWACREMADQVGHDAKATGHDVVFWPQNWRKGGLQPRRAEIIREQNFYNQTWCGCEFSEHHDTK